jgi:hypothetical protein
MICPICMENAAMVASGIASGGGLAVVLAGRFRRGKILSSNPTQIEESPSNNKEEVEHGNCNGRTDEA